MTAAIQRHDGYIVSVEIVERGARSVVYWELDAIEDPDSLERSFLAIDAVTTIRRLPSMFQVYGKRIIVVGAGAQVGQVALGAIGEADRHNIRGEKISIDTIPIVGEENLANAVRAVARLPRAVALVLAGSLMGGEVTDAVDELRGHGIMVVSLNMPRAAGRLSRRRAGRRWSSGRRRRPCGEAGRCGASSRRRSARRPRPCSRSERRRAGAAGRAWRARWRAGTVPCSWWPAPWWRPPRRDRPWRPGLPGAGRRGSAARWRRRPGRRPVAWSWPPPPARRSSAPPGGRPAAPPAFCRSPARSGWPRRCGSRRGSRRPCATAAR